MKIASDIRPKIEALLAEHTDVDYMGSFTDDDLIALLLLELYKEKIKRR